MAEGKTRIETGPLKTPVTGFVFFQCRKIPVSYGVKQDIRLKIHVSIITQ